jgi:small multidrug resistance family-3 protein
MVRSIVMLLVLLVSACLEAGGDAVVRLGLQTSGAWRRIGTLCAGGVILLAYGTLVNTVPLDFGRMIGTYIIFFFLVAQAIAFITFGQLPTRGLWVGGILILVGALIISIDTQ